MFHFCCFVIQVPASLSRKAVEDSSASGPLQHLDGCGTGSGLLAPGFNLSQPQMLRTEPGDIRPFFLSFTLHLDLFLSLPHRSPFEINIEHFMCYIPLWSHLKQHFSKWKSYINLKIYSQKKGKILQSPHAKINSGF